MLRFIRTLFLTLPLLSLPAFGADFQTDIVGGTQARRGEFPFIVSLQNARGHFCGGSLVAPDWVLTAAHCVIKGAPTAVVTGLYDQLDRQGTELLRPSAVVIHPGYRRGGNDYDYALIRLDGTSKAKTISLNRRPLGAAPTVLTVAGWGVVQERGSLARFLQKVNVPLASQEACAIAYPGAISPRMLCAGVPQGGRDSCQGDSGGPLTLTLNGQRTLAGVVSWGDGCARQGRYGIYSDVSQAYDWIHGTMGK